MSTHPNPSFAPSRVSPLWLVEPFSPISLDQLNSKAAMLERLDNKYVVRADVLQAAIESLVERFDILDMNGTRAFTYETCYFDDEQLHSYFDHHQGRRRRCKVRVRKYTDAQLCFVEVKLKDKRGLTVKKRLEYSMDKYGTLDDSAWMHIRQSYEALYGEAFPHRLAPVIEMRYQRITLVAREGGERMTIDCHLRFQANGRTRTTGPDVFVVETKSANGNGVADKILRSLHQHPTKSCSKYCVGMAALQTVERHNKFLPALRKLDALPHRGSPLQNP
ncbi:MAG: vacuolar transporter [Comamonadaceae bacterium]|nr:vacuolar transporter [Comamonadaceae bacterium]